MAKVCLISVPRTGSNHLCKMLKNFESVKSSYEIFNNSGSFGLNEGDLEYINNKFDKDFQSNKDENLISFLKEKPFEILDALEESAALQGKSVFVFKLFPKQLSEDILDKLLTRKDIQFAFILRRCIDSYISYEKARISDIWHSKSTTGEMVELNYESFFEWYKDMESWYLNCEKKLKSISSNYSFIVYERDIDCAQKSLLNSFRLNMRPLGVDLKPVNNIKNKGFSKQDKKTKLADKISNWDEFKTALHEKGAFYQALGYFL